MPTPVNPQLATVGTVLTDDLLAGIRDRATAFDEANAFPHEDLEALFAAGYLGALAPTAAGGLGWDLATVVAAQRVLAMHSPATALAVNMHQIWNGVASVLARQGDDSLSFVHRESAAGEVFAFGISEAGNDAVLFDSDTVAEPLGDGSYRFTGTKIFTTLSPAWTRLGVFGKTPDGGQLVFGFLDRTAEAMGRDEEALVEVARSSSFAATPSSFTPDPEEPRQGRAPAAARAAASSARSYRSCAVPNSCCGFSTPAPTCARRWRADAGRRDGRWGCRRARRRRRGAGGRLSRFAAAVRLEPAGGARCRGRSAGVVALGGIGRGAGCRRRACGTTPRAPA